MKLFFRKLGQGHPLVILHGLFGMSDNWMSMGKSLAEKFTVYLPDLRDHGRSPHSDVFNHKAMSDDLHELLDDLSIEKTYLLGHSLGGKAAMTFATTFPQRVEKLVIADIGPGHYPVQHTGICNALLSIDLKAIHTRKEVEEKLQTQIRDVSTLQLLMKNLFYSPDGSFAWRMNAGVICKNLEAVGCAVVPQRPYMGPTLFIRGERSNYIQDTEENNIRSIFPSAIIQTIPGAGHWIHSEKPEPFREVLIDFLS